jgi:hypothetical protein
MPRCKIEPQTTTKKFYNKWLYKITIEMAGVSLFRYNNLEDLANEKYVRGLSFRSFRPMVMIDHKDVGKLANFLLNSDELWSKRIESVWMDLYTNSKSFYDRASDAFSDKVIHRFEPIPGTEHDLNELRTIIVKKLPHNKYNLKVYLAPHNGTLEERHSFINFLNTHCSKIKCTDAVKSWMTSRYADYDRRYILVEDEPTLLILKMAYGKMLGKTYYHKVVDK